MRRLFPPFVSGPGSVGLLVSRLVTGAAFVLHGWGKIQNPLHWMDQMPDAPPGPIQTLAAVAEFGGGIALILGLLTPVFAFLIAGTMVVALAKVHLPAGHVFVSSSPEQHSYEIAAIYLAEMILFLLVGPGTLSADACLFGRKKINGAV
jgi:putative oxidoreductase